MITFTNVSSISSCRNSFCVDARPFSDIDGDTEVQCVHDGKCLYQRIVKDHDGDVKIMCDKY